ncbi:hypothetical protein FSW04_19840 [Baekduia soli]|uniref:Peptidase S51 n=1 Tax=Baekduia soli TaxID=496014 RepID=A0A5B8U8X8_9ACTN|nr:hypothetical protein [Baekduia soli]QEC49599.1 hypothetical protein FSW04_19840 [Baekduia soli]
MTSGPFLIGGGREPGGVLATHRPFVAACGAGTIAVLAADEGDGVDEERWRAALTGAGASAVRVCVLSRARPTIPDVAGAAGVYVAGGPTPLYAALLDGWRPPPGIPYAGFSAGAAVAAARAIVGGWRAPGGEGVCPQDAGEGLDDVTIARGLGLVPFAVDVHAGQWGTLGRLVHAVGSGLVPAGWALDEGTLLAGGEVHGTGAAWHVAARPGGGAAVRRVTAC